MSTALNYVQSEHVLALLIALIIFLITIFLVARRWIGFPVTLLFLLFALAAGLIINNQKDVQHYLGSPARLSSSLETPEGFHNQMLQAMEDFKLEVSTEKDNLKRVITQVQEIFDSMDVQKQKLQNFIDEAREQFKTEYQKKSSSTTTTTLPNQPAPEPSQVP
jgi:hypothetical protein